MFSPNACHNKIRRFWAFFGLSFVFIPSPQKEVSEDANSAQGGFGVSGHARAAPWDSAALSQSAQSDFAIKRTSKIQLFIYINKMKKLYFSSEAAEMWSCRDP